MTPNEQHSVKADTEYVVLKRDPAPKPLSNQATATTNPPGGWHYVDLVAGRDAAAAIRAVVGEPLTEGVNGEYVAVPARSWKPVTVAVKVERSLVIGGAS